MTYEVFIATPWMDDVLFDSFVQHHKIEDYVVNQIRNGDRAYLFVLYDGQIKSYFGDRGEPEDNSFTRDWSWIAPALEEAYTLGYKRGKDNKK